ncbi:hypothetical protein [Streptomyces sp. NPDC014685]|uniref:hypothetical protein n=1 Tax=Streptomyces sp. NPDC014685 TaxID=3364881 RepID=UPI0036F9B8BE
MEVPISCTSAGTAQGWAREHEGEQVRARQAAAKAHRAEAAAAQPVDDVPAAPAAMPAPRPAPVVVPAPEPEFADDDQELVFDHIDRYGEPSAQRLFPRAFVAQVQRLARLGHLDLGYTTWGQA